MAQIEEFPKFQYSEFIKTGTKDGQFVIRAETIEEFKKGLDEIQIALGLKGEKLGTNIAHAELDEPPHPAEKDGGWCREHGTSMTQGFSKTKRDANNNPKPYWFHKENGKMCFGSGFKD